MRTGLVVRKIGMSAIFSDNGERIPVTLLKLEDCQIVGHRNVEKNGYNALIVGIKNIPLNRVAKPLKNMFTQAKIESKAILREFRIDDNSFVDIGTDINVDHFTIGQFVDATGTTIGKGFAGSMKRWNFRGLEASHGVSISHRSHGSTGGRQDPGKVFKNKKMAGHMGCRRVTMQNLRIIDLNLSENIIIVSGNVPGSKGGLILIKDSIKKNAV